MNPSDQIVEVELAFTEAGRWYRTDMSVVEYTQVLRTGMIEGQPVAAIKNTVCTSEIGTSYIIYDFILAKRGIPPWRSFDVLPESGN